MNRSKRILNTVMFIGIQFIIFIIIAVNARVFFSYYFRISYYSITASLGIYVIMAAVGVSSVLYCLEKPRAEFYLILSEVVGVIWLITAHLSLSSMYLIGKTKTVWYLIPVWCIAMGVHVFYLVKNIVMQKRGQ